MSDFKKKNLPSTTTTCDAHDGGRSGSTKTTNSSQDIQNDLSRRERDPDWWRDPFAMYEESDAESAEDISSYSSSNDSSEDDAEVNSGEVLTQHQDEQD